MTTHRKKLDNILTALKGLIAESEKTETHPSYTIEGGFELDAVFAALTKAIGHEDFKRSPELIETMKRIRLESMSVIRRRSGGLQMRPIEFRGLRKDGKG